ncbi:PEGA domain-containing protein [Pseudomonas sp. N040]|uniref:PEGA domain-containing protein n=1 Tax=Pseudomonas sp. N040 TaxID=2785325 RepID=UPI0018A29BEA|nr:PEGA domain-containing protein [Pseudomonas sp. N040]MBF7729277.1 PEGA domain-containing protein [Pseudomonas sp. N040]MBW7012917.1 PEGA domain-containing protein [Pseudomonas sp. N040]
MKQSKSFLTISLGIALISGCATIIDGKSEPVTFNSEPEGATVNVAGRVMGKTPVTVQVERDENLAVTFTKDGYKQYQTQLGTTTNGWFWGNIVLGGVFGSTTDASTGAMYEFSPNQYFATLSPDTPLGVSTSKPRQIKEIIVGDGAKFRHELATGGGETTETVLFLIGVNPTDKPTTIKSLAKISENTPNDLEFANSIIAVYEIK